MKGPLGEAMLSTLSPIQAASLPISQWGIDDVNDAAVAAAAK